MIPLNNRFHLAVIREHGCAGCFYAERSPDPLDRPFECHRNPPDPRERWPEVHGTDWCGEWSPAEETVDEEAVAHNVAAIAEARGPDHRPIDSIRDAGVVRRLMGW